MARRNPNPKDEFLAAALAGVAIGAIGYGCYKLFGSSSGEQVEHQDAEKMPTPIPFRTNSQHPFPKDSKTYVVNTIEECRSAMRELKSHCDEYSVLGFDCEWETLPGSGRQKVALLQLASHRGLCVLVRLSELNHIPRELKEILLDRNILKVGITPNTDARYLSEDYFCNQSYNFSDNQYDYIRGTLDLRFVSKMAKCDSAMGLAKMSEFFLGVPMEKKLNVRCSDWECQRLSAEQISYATLDALVAIELYKFFAEQIARNESCSLPKVIHNSSESADMDFRGN